ncbi:peptidoglycan-associated lipoprotein Pal [Curvivirga sp.]|uniref:peptidoglycan-associated lipoprotein Pal n=1 Tax=Curvivirga sp. TaxID=2856848 RepID=UPI003B5AB65C
MRFKILSLLAALVLVAACETAPEESAGGNTGGNTGGSTQAAGTDGSNGGTNLNEIVAGSETDFVVNVGDRVFFNYDRSDLSSDAQSALAKQAAWLLQYPQVMIQVEGHCDERGTREYNLALGERRANSVKEYLTSLGVAADRISTISYGKERPAVEGSNKEAWAQNRRGVSRVVGGANS